MLPEYQKILNADLWHRLMKLGLNFLVYTTFIYNPWNFLGLNFLVIWFPKDILQTSSISAQLLRQFSRYPYGRL